MIHNVELTTVELTMVRFAMNEYKNKRENPVDKRIIERIESKLLETEKKDLFRTVKV